MSPASFGSRASATVFDILIVMLISGVPYWFFQQLGAFNPGDELSNVLQVVAFMIAWVVYVPATMMRPGDRRGQTIGKQVTKIRVVRNGNLRFYHVLARDIIKPIWGFAFYAAPPVGILAALYWLSYYKIPNHQLLHDLLVKTTVVEDRFLVETVDEVEIV